MGQEEPSLKMRFEPSVCPSLSPQVNCVGNLRAICSVILKWESAMRDIFLVFSVVALFFLKASVRWNRTAEEQQNWRPGSPSGSSGKHPFSGVEDLALSAQLCAEWGGKPEVTQTFSRLHTAGGSRRQGRIYSSCALCAAGAAGHCLVFPVRGGPKAESAAWRLAWVRTLQRGVRWTGVKLKEVSELRETQFWRVRKLSR